MKSIMVNPSFPNRIKEQEQIPILVDDSIGDEIHVASEKPPTKGNDLNNYVVYVSKMITKSFKILSINSFSNIVSR